MRHHIRQTHITDELQTGKVAGAAGGFPASGAQYHPLTSAPPRSRASPEPVHDAGVLRVAPRWRHGRQIPRLFHGSHAVQPPQTDNFIQLLFRDAGMQAKFGNSKSHRNISHYAFPNLYVDQKTTGCLPVAATARQCFHPVSAASRFSVPHTDRRSVFAHQTFAFNAQSLPGTAARRDSQQNAFFQCWNGDFSTQRRFHGLTGTTISRSWPTISNSGCGAI